MAASIYDWSLTASANGNADGDINFSEGQAPSTVNNSARQVMARVAELRDDLGSNVTVGGTANAITVTAKSAFSTYATGQRIVFKAGFDNNAATTLNANSIGAKSIRKIGSGGDIALDGGEIQEGCLYEAIYSASLNSSAGGWQLMSPLSIIDPVVRNDYVPTGAGMDYWLPDLPDGYIWADGATLLPDTPYTALRTAFINAGFPHGQDGSGNPKIPDKRGRASFGKDNMGGTSANRLTGQTGGIDGDTLGAVGGAETHTLSIAQMPSHNHGGYVGESGSITYPRYLNLRDGGSAVGVDLDLWSFVTNISTSNHTHAISSQGGGSAHNNVPPGLVCNHIIKT